MAYTYSKLASVSVGSGGSSTITFSNIPQNYTDLVLKMSLRSESTAANWALIGINGGSDSAVTLRHLLNFNGTIYAQTYSSLRTVNNINTGTSNAFTNSELYFPSYSSSNLKVISGDGVQANNSTTASLQLAAFLWSNTTGINRLSLTVDGGGDFNEFSTATLYGIRVEL